MLLQHQYLTIQFITRINDQVKLKLHLCNEHQNIITSHNR